MTDDTSHAATAASISEPSPLLLPDLPGDVVLDCIARVPFSDHPSLSLVCKSWRSILLSDLFYKTRLRLNCTQTFLFLYLSINSTVHCYLLDQNRRTLSVPPIPPPRLLGPALSVVGPKIYVIGGITDDNLSNSIRVFDCRFNRWELGPQMSASRGFTAAKAVNGKIYVIGGCVNDNWAEVFDTDMGSWAAIPSPPTELRERWIQDIAFMSDRIYAMTDNGVVVVYDAVKGEWGKGSTGLGKGWQGRGAVVNEVLYCFDKMGTITWYDVKKDEWKELIFVENCLPKFVCGAKMVNVGEGRLCVVWEGKRSGNKKEIMCAEIEVRKDECFGLSGSVVRSDVMMLVDWSDFLEIVDCVAVRV